MLRLQGNFGFPADATVDTTSSPIRRYLLQQHTPSECIISWANTEQRQHTLALGSVQFGSVPLEQFRRRGANKGANAVGGRAQSTALFIVLTLPALPPRESPSLLA